jgi:hypothetical protein
MHLAYPKHDVWMIIYEFVVTACMELDSDGISPPSPPCSEVWSMLSDTDKEDAWILLLEWLEQHDVLEILNELSDSDWCRNRRHYVAEPGSDSHAPYGRDPLLCA